VIRDSNTYFRIDSDPGIRRIASKMQWIIPSLALIIRQSFVKNDVSDANKSPKLSYSTMLLQVENWSVICI